MQLSADLAIAYLDDAFGKLRAAVDRVGDDELNVRPFGPSTNAIAGLVVHCTELAPAWLGHVGLGEPTDRQRDAEFGTEASRAELHGRIDRSLAACHALVRRLDAEGGTPHDLRVLLYGDGGDASIVLHVLEELYQHLGHVELTIDALAARR
jgi:hypothetical protein